MMTVDERRASVVAEAMSWIGTPYHPAARIKGRNGGVDCLTLLLDVYAGAGEIPRVEEVPHYPPDWHLHQTEELYLNGKDGVPGVLHWCDEVAAPAERKPLPGDIVMLKIGNCFAHGMIVVQWPVVVHAYSKRPVGRDDAERTSALIHTIELVGRRNELRDRRFFTLKTWS